MKNCHCFSLINESAIGIAALLLVGNAAAINTHIQTDGSLSGITEFNINAPGSSHPYTLSEINGKLSGHNLFYSFSNFSIGTTDTAWFNLNTPDLANVISRVTGGAESIIDGQLKMTNVGSAPSFFFINPAGITFNSGASVDVPGSFYVSTASHLKFSDGSQYAANETNASSLSSANPESFGFLGNEVGNLNLHGTEAAKVNIDFQPESDVVFAANQININQAKIASADNSKAGLDLQLLATGNKATNIKLDTLDNQTTTGQLVVRNTSLDASGNGSGRIAIRSGDFFTNDSKLFVYNTGSISMNAENAIDIVSQSQFRIENTQLSSIASSDGKSGNVAIIAEFLQILDSGAIRSFTKAQGSAGAVMVNSKQIHIDGRDSEFLTGIYSDTGQDSSGNAGAVTVTASTLDIVDNGGIRSSTYSQGDAGDVTINAEKVDINGQNGQFITGIYSDTNRDSSGNAGAVTVTTGTLNIADNGNIRSSTYSQGNAGDVTINAEKVDINGRNSQFITGIYSDTNQDSGGNAGAVTVTTDTLNIADNGNIVSSTYSQGNAGNLTIKANLINLTNSSFIRSVAYTQGMPGAILIDTEALALTNGSAITMGTLNKSGIGNLAINSERIEIDKSAILSLTLGDGKAGDIFIETNSLKLSYSGEIDPNIKTGIESSTFAKGNGGNVIIKADDQIEMRNGFIAAKTEGEGSAGNVLLKADSLILMDAGIVSNTLSDKGGDGGLVFVDARKLEMNNGDITSDALKGGYAGSIDIKAKFLLMDNASRVSSTTLAAGASGKVSINADELTIKSDSFIQSETFGSGKAGNISISGDTLNLNSGGLISSSSRENQGGYGGDKNGDGGDVAVNIKLLNIDHGAIFSNAGGNGGNAGNVIIQSDTLKLSNRSLIVSSTLDGATGNGGIVKIDTRQLEIDNANIGTTTFGNGNAGKVIILSNSLNLKDGSIESAARDGSSGQTGNIEIDVETDIQLNDAQVTISNDATVTEDKLISLTPTAVNIGTTSLFLTNSRITADSNGNVDAGNINIHFADQLFLDPSQISTEAASGNGGDIRIQGNGAVFLLDSAITTSVSGQSGNGGDIVIAAKGVILDSGFIQANTAASGASGGKVDIQTPALIPSGSSLFVGGNTPFQFQPFSGLNVIQAAAPDGVSGTISTVTPQLNLNAMMTYLMIESFDSNALNRDMCSISDSSSLMQSGRGAQPLRARDLLLSPSF